MALITNHWNLDGIIILATLIIAIYFYMTRNFNYWRNRGVLEASSTPFVGSLKDCLLMKVSPQHFLRDLYQQAAKKEKPYIGFYILDKPALCICDPKILQNIFIKDFNNFSARYSSADPNDRVGYANLFFVKNPAWKILRMKLTPFFTSGKMKNMFSLMQQYATNFENYLDRLELDGDGKIIDVKSLSTKFTGNMISITAFGFDMDPFQNEDDEFCKIAEMMFDVNYKRTLELFAIFFLPHISEMLHIKIFGKQPTKFIREKFWETFNKRVYSGQKRNDLIDTLIELQRNHADEEIEGFKFHGDDLTAQAASFYSAGFDTTAMPIVFSLLELARNPDIQSKLRQEILETFEKFDENMTYDMVSSNLPYLDMVINETLRLYPPLGFLNRHAIYDYKIPDTDLVIEKGTPIYIPMLGFHYDPQYFPNPSVFDPERFSEENKRHIHSCTYFPFGQGRRMCIAMRYAIILVKLMILKLLSKYEITCEELNDKSEGLIDKGSMTQPLHGIMNLKIRKIKPIN